MNGLPLRVTGSQFHWSPSARLDRIHLRIIPLKGKEAGVFILQLLALSGNGLLLSQLWHF